MKKMLGLRVLTLVAALVVVVSPEAASAQCANCNPLGGFHCSWGPWISGWRICWDIPGGCALQDDTCSETFALDLDGRVLRPRDKTLTIQSVVDAQLVGMSVAAFSATINTRFESLFTLRDCKGYLVAGGFPVDESAGSITDIPVISI